MTESKYFKNRAQRIASESDDKPIQDPVTQVASSDVPGVGLRESKSKSLRAAPATEYLTVSDTTSRIVLSSTDLGKHRRLVGLMRKLGVQATIFKALKF